MDITEVQITLVEVGSSGRLRAFCSVVFDDSFVIQELKIINGNRGLFVSMPSKMIKKHCAGCGQNNKVTANFCNNCGKKFNQEETPRQDIYTDVAYPINSETREDITREVIKKYREAVSSNIV